ncbi:hypothetical protein PIB30_118665 [Stylosanthes scabra]|uniref:RRM domain-containing protein n=1 Tax=Stylosanthes scabra TaxID=79078 RepID=A0ABU6ZK96_9FABA|nr:hypothetical protein [Stylosanthes scabra]
MGSVDRDGDRAFKANFTADGAAKLKESVKEKLKEFMGEYTDDTLVEYVIVLLRNGRKKDEARNELNVFLGDDSDSFISWLWDHLELHLDSYVQPKELQNEAPKKKLVSEFQSEELERGKSDKLSRSRHNKDWKGLVRGEAEPPPIRSCVVDTTHVEDKAESRLHRGQRSLSPKSPVQKKRGRADEPQWTKRDAVSQMNIAAPRRLLQFAVRDAVATSRSSNLGSSVEPSLKRLRSVVSTSTGDTSLVERPRRIQSVSRVANPMAPVLKAVADAAEDVIKYKPSRSVFDRLGRGMDASDDNNPPEDNYQHQERDQSLFLQSSDYIGQSNETMVEHETGFPYDSISDNEGFGDVNVMDHRVTGASRNRVNDSLMLQYSVAKNAEDDLHLKCNREQEQISGAPKTSHKIVNISVNVNTWKPPHYHDPREVKEINDHNTLDSETRAPRTGLRLVKENASTLKTSNGNANTAPDVQKESNKAQLSSGLSASGRPSEDADSRTIFVSNVHFAATKDGLSRHFNKCGEVLKVVIVTDAATGQPKGAAYVEFMRKEAAESALSLDGTSYLSRVLKVFKKSAAPQESSLTMTYPRVARGSTFPAARFPRLPFARGVPGAFRAWPTTKLGARSLQWKRDAGGQSDNGTSSSAGTTSAPVSRGFTYVRTEPKPETK